MRRRGSPVDLDHDDFREVWFESTACFDPAWLAERDATGARAEAERLSWELRESDEEVDDEWLKVEARAWLAWPGRERWLRSGLVTR